MNVPIFEGLVSNVAIMLSFSMLYDYWWAKETTPIKFLNKIITGIIIGAIGIVLMLIPWVLLPGLIFDMRSVLLSITGLFFGIVPTISAMVILSLYRIILGGDGLWMGVAVIISSGTIGMLWNRFRPGWNVKYYVVELFVMGLIVHIIMLSCSILLPPDRIYTTLKTISAPVLVIYPVAVVLLGALMIHQNKNWQNRNAKEKLAELEKEKVAIADILDASLNDIYIYDLETLKFKYVNVGACNNLGYSFNELTSMTPLDLKKEFSMPFFLSIIEPLKSEEKQIQVFKANHYRKDGSIYPVEIHLQLCNYKNGKAFLAVGQDITIRTQIENELIKAKEKAVESDRLKSAFLANMSHEIRTPMNAIMGFSTLLADPDLSTIERRQYTNIISSSGNSLLNIINDIIDVSKIEAKQLILKVEECKLYDVFNSSVSIFRKSEQLLNKPDLKLILNYPEEYKKFSVQTDCNRLLQVLDNLIGNAIKYSLKGKIETGFSFTKENGQPYIEIYVKDTGIGISSENSELVFERFRQVNEFGFHEGAGLGLSISKGIVEMLGGKIWFKSEIGKGSEFYFTIPDKRADSIVHHSDIVRDKLISLEGRTVLIAEDDYNSYMILRLLMRDLNARIVYAENGQMMMGILKESVPDLILLDINMPVKNGFECLKEIASLGYKTKIIAQTAYATPEEEKMCINMGCHGYVSKPISKQRLFDEISKVMSFNS